MRDKDFAAVEDPVAIDERSGRQNIGRVAARRGLSQCPRSNLIAAGERWQKALALLIGAESVEMGHTETVMRGDGKRDCRAHASQLLDTEAVVEGRHGRTPVLLGHLNAHQT